MRNAVARGMSPGRVGIGSLIREVRVAKRGSYHIRVRLGIPVPINVYKYFAYRP